MRQAKTKKQSRNTNRQEMRHQKKTVKKKQAERDNKYAEWEKLPQEQWTEARKNALSLKN